MKFRKTLVFFLFIIFSGHQIHSQNISSSSYGKGHKILAKDSSFLFNFEARFQNLYIGTADLETDAYSDQFLVRRARLKFKGFAYDPRITYKFELGLTNRDIASGGIPQSRNIANIVLDAVVKYNFYSNWSIWFGQTKLPGNIERVISSGALQFVNRSNLNAKYNIDRDAGIQIRYESDYFRLKTAISMGEGRNITVPNAGGYDYTGRVEWLPFGDFTGNGDYFAADLKRENDIKLMLGLTYDYNVGSSREGGQLGDFLSEQRDLKTIFADAHLKYKGFSTMVEYANKETSDSPLIVRESGALESFYVGSGFNAQAGYLFQNNFEIAIRYTEVNPNQETLHKRNQQYTFGISKYLVGHKLKAQSDISYITEDTKSDKVRFRLQVEVTL